MTFSFKSFLAPKAGFVFLLTLLIPGFLAIRERNYHHLRNTGPADWGAAFTPEANTEAWLRAALRSQDWQAMAAYPRPSAILEETLKPLPADKGILLIANPNDPNFLTVFSIIQYFSVPRRVSHLDCTATATTAPRHAPIAAVMYFNVASSKTIPQGRNILPLLTFVPVTQPAEWKSYCLP